MGSHLARIAPSQLTPLAGSRTGTAGLMGTLSGIQAKHRKGVAGTVTGPRHQAKKREQNKPGPDAQVRGAVDYCAKESRR